MAESSSRFNMLTLRRMIGFAVLAYLVSGVVTTLITAAAMLQWMPPAIVYQRAAQGDRDSRLVMALNSEKMGGMINLIWVTALAGTVYGLERWWHSRHPWPRQVRVHAIVRWLGAVAAGLLVALWLRAAYILVLVLIFPGHCLSSPSYCRDEWISLGQQLNARETLSIIVWIVAIIALGWRASSRADEPQRCPTCGRVVSYGGDLCGKCGQSLCPTCGSTVSDDAVKCPACGTKFTLSCPNCGANVAARDTACSQCGQAFA